MISRVTGPVVSLGGTWVVIDVGGLGLHMHCTPATAAALRPGEEATLHTSLVVRQDALTLYGFADERERTCFETVQLASGVGPKLGMTVVSVLSPERLVAAIRTEDLATLCTVPGVGRKSAQKIVIELKDRISSIDVDDQASVAQTSTAEQTWRAPVAAGLQSLGWSAKEAEAACERVGYLYEEDPQITVAALLRAALQGLSRHNVAK